MLVLSCSAVARACGEGCGGWAAQGRHWASCGVSRGRGGTEGHLLRRGEEGSSGGGGGGRGWRGRWRRRGTGSSLKQSESCEPKDGGTPDTGPADRQSMLKL